MDCLDKSMKAMDILPEKTDVYKMYNILATIYNFSYYDIPT